MIEKIKKPLDISNIQKKYLMRIFNINFRRKSKKVIDEKIHLENYDRYKEIGNLVKEARIQKNLSIKELSEISKIPVSSIDSIEKNIKDIRPKYPFIRSILLKLEKCLSLEDNILVDLTIEETNIFNKSKNKKTIRKFDFINSWKGIFFYFLFLISILYILNRYFISNIDIIEFEIIEKKVK